LLNIIVGLEQPSGGEVRVGGIIMNDIDPKDRNMAMVFQSYAIYPHMSVRDNLAFPLKLAGCSRSEISQRVETAAQILELDDLLDRRPASLSGGQRQRVAMGRAMVREPAAFLMDEPLSNLDARLRVQMRTEIARLQRRLGTTTVYVTHDQTEAMTLGERVAVMRDGAIQQIGTPRELYTAPANLFVAGFIGSPGMNFFPARIQDQQLLLPMASLPSPADLDLPPDTDRLIAGIRPEHINAHAAPGNATFTVSVDVREWLGADLYAYFEVDTSDWPDIPSDIESQGSQSKRITCVARLDSSHEFTEGETLSLGFDPADLYLFDADSGQRLARLR
jgi:multiple sugar transport system ATP-binding protein